MKINYIVFKLSIALCLCVYFGFSQNIDLKQSIPFSQKIKSGTLDNGLKYYILNNSIPQGRVELKLIIKVGSVLEEDNEQGLAHFLEHMNFNGTKNFPKNKLRDYLKSIGVEMGQHINAQTGFDETVYSLSIPNDDKEKINQGFQILEDWAFNPHLTIEEINKERVVVLEEMKAGLGTDKSLIDKYLPTLFYQSQYSKRMPIGKKEIIETFDIKTLENFRNNWYRPELMAIIAVGDENTDFLEEKIKTHFGSQKNKKKAKNRNVFELPDHKQSVINIVTDTGANVSLVRVVYKATGLPKEVQTNEDYKKAITTSLISIMINNRMNEIKNNPNSPFGYISSGYSFIGIRTKEAYSFMSVSREDGQINALKSILTETQRVIQHGFTQTELERAKEELLSQTELDYNERNNTESQILANELVRHFLDKEVVPGKEWEFETQKKILPMISMAEVNTLAKTLYKNDNRVVIFTGPEKKDLNIPTEAEVKKVIDSLAGINTEPYVDNVINTHLMSEFPKSGTIVSETRNDTLGTKTLYLSNGVKVIYKYTNFKKDQILFKGQSLGGNSLFTDEEYFKTRWAMQGLIHAGINDLSINDLQNMLSGVQANVSPFISDISETVNGNSTVKDLEVMFQLFYLMVTKLNKNDSTFKVFIENVKTNYKNAQSNPQYIFYNEFSKIIEKNNRRFKSIFPTDEELDATDYDLAYQKYMERFSNFADFTFYLVGSFDEIKLRVLIKKYLASLPSNPDAPKEMYVDLGNRPIKGAHKKVVKKGKEPQGFILINKFKEIEYDKSELFAMSGLSFILKNRLKEKIIEKGEEESYQIEVRGNLSKIPSQVMSFNITLSCDPKKVDSILIKINKEINDIIQKGVKEEELKQYVETEFKAEKENIMKNEYWLEFLSASEFIGFDPKEIYNAEYELNRLTTKKVHEIAKKYLTQESIIGILLPE